jgi:hypothetical protein
MNTNLDGAIEMKRKQILLLIVACKYNAENCGREVKQLGFAIRRPTKATMHSGRQFALVIETNETSYGLVDRLRSFLEVSAFENYWCFTPGIDVASKNGSMDPLTTYIKDALLRRVERRNANHVSYR